MSKLFIQSETLSAIGNAIRDKAGTSDMISPGNMPQAIADIPSGGGGDPIAITLHAKPYGLAGDGGKLIMDNRTKFSITVSEDDPNTNVFNADDFFAGNDSVSQPNFTYLKFAYPRRDTQEMLLGYVYRNCGTKYMHPFEYINTRSGVDSNSIKIRGYKREGGYFEGCCCLTLVHPIKGKNPFVEDLYTKGFFRNFMGDFIDPEFVYEVTHKSDPSYGYGYAEIFKNCARLKAITNISCLWVNEDFSAARNYMFENAFNFCARCERLTFHTNEDGTPEVAPLDNTVINLTDRFGWDNTSYSKYDYIGEREGSYGNPHNAIPYNNRVEDIDSYNAHKDDYYYWAYAPEWSRYNHDRAVETINSLPDTLTGCRRVASLGADYTPNNTIVFLGACGSGYGKAISDLTEAEIAVATAKGWQVRID